MANYVITGHPLNYGNLGLSISAEVRRGAVQAAGIGQTITLDVTGADDVKAKGHGVLK